MVRVLQIFISSKTTRSDVACQTSQAVFIPASGYRRPALEPQPCAQCRPCYIGIGYRDTHAKVRANNTMWNTCISNHFAEYVTCVIAPCAVHSPKDIGSPARRRRFILPPRLSDDCHDPCPRLQRSCTLGELARGQGRGKEAVG